MGGFFNERYAGPLEMAIETTPRIPIDPNFGMARENPYKSRIHIGRGLHLNRNNFAAIPIWEIKGKPEI